jgi:GWxTD domain-containing protein
MRRQILSILFALALTPAAFAAPSVQQQLTEAQKKIGAKQFAEASLILENALEQIETLPEDVREQARTAVHFYAAVAYSGQKKDDQAMAHLEEVLRLSPEIRAVDPAKYDKHFIELFSDARAAVAGSGSFDELYSGFSRTAAVETPTDPLAFRQGVALELLGTKAEKRRWHDLVSEEERSRFVAEFWRLRDSKPETPANEFREDFERRMSFADATFGYGGVRGALTDRGRVFILLGVPARVRRRALDLDQDRIQVFNVGSRNIELGDMEYWVYTQAQLPHGFSKPSVTYRFVSHQGIGHFVMQKDGIPVNVLAMAASVREQ